MPPLSVAPPRWTRIQHSPAARSPALPGTRTRTLTQMRTHPTPGPGLGSGFGCGFRLWPRLGPPSQGDAPGLRLVTSVRTRAPARLRCGPGFGRGLGSRPPPTPGSGVAPGSDSGSDTDPKPGPRLYLGLGRGLGCELGPQPGPQPETAVQTLTRMRPQIPILDPSSTQDADSDLGPRLAPLQTQHRHNTGTRGPRRTLVLPAPPGANPSL